MQSFKLALLVASSGSGTGSLKRVFLTGNTFFSGSNIIRRGVLQ
jgi:hypothetical protein